MFGQKKIRKYLERGGVRNLYVTYELFDSNQFNDGSIKVIRNYGHGIGDTTI